MGIDQIDQHHPNLPPIRGITQGYTSAAMRVLTLGQSRSDVGERHLDP
jgi:hypothetical protein